MSVYHQVWEEDKKQEEGGDFEQGQAACQCEEAP